MTTKKALTLFELIAEHIDDDKNGDDVGAMATGACLAEMIRTYAHREYKKRGLPELESTDQLRESVEFNSLIVDGYVAATSSLFAHLSPTPNECVEILKIMGRDLLVGVEIKITEFPESQIKH